ncbi:MAG: hypothetical protein IJO85_01495 [Lachnospiraceae bacterium]|nr:hypothetical protein [Lachnospiraceae bacterium]
MLTVLFNWLYIFITTLSLGYAFSKCIEKKLHYRIKRLYNLAAVGLVIATVYAQVFSIFYKVGLVANLLLIISCIGSIVLYRQQMKADIEKYGKKLFSIKGVVIVALVLLWAYFTSRGIIHYDTDLYHAQSIRWIEEYGVVPGLGNLHVRFAYNSSVFALSALYSMKFLLGQSLHTISGFFALLLSISAMDIMGSWQEKRFRLSDFARIAAIYYLTMICDEVVSPASDYVIMCTIFYLVIEWLTVLEASKEKSESIVPYALLCVGGVFAVSLKLTAGLILILVIKPAYMLIREKRWKEILLYISIGLIVITPWIVRTVLISGYLLYPFPSLDLFDVDWKIPTAAATLDAAEIKTWGRAIYDASKVGMPIQEWFPNWFSTTLSGTEKLLILADIVTLFVLVVIAAWQISRKKWRELDFLLVMAAVAASYLFWQISAPLMRYGYSHVLLLVALTAGYLLQRFMIKRKRICQVFYALVLVIGIAKLVPLYSYAVSVGGQSFYLTQKDYGKYESVSYKIEGVTFYYPVEGDRIGYEAFPSATTKVDIEFRGKSIEEGFRLQNLNF